MIAYLDRDKLENDSIEAQIDGNPISSRSGMGKISGAAKEKLGKKEGSYISKSLDNSFFLACIW